jgi:hypothetical protein
VHDSSDQDMVAKERIKNPVSLAYLSIFAGAVIGVGALTVLGARGIVSTMEGLPFLPIRIFGLVLLVSGFLAIGMLSGGIPPRSPDADPLVWWKANSVRAVSTWAAAEGMAIAGGVFWLLSGDVILYGCLVGGGLVLLLLNRPQRMMEG